MKTTQELLEKNVPMFHIDLILLGINVPFDSKLDFGKQDYIKPFNSSNSILITLCSPDTP